MKDRRQRFANTSPKRKDLQQEVEDEAVIAGGLLAIDAVGPDLPAHFPREHVHGASSLSRCTGKFREDGAEHPQAGRLSQEMIGRIGIDREI